ncbi:MAG: chaperone modulator CbpM [Nitrospira sp.]|jgi:chaperone modulatory protein CbpM|nr:MAG: MerR family transcriptional regulator [Nitrospira sp. CG24D]TKB82636.1 MAG: MerR family transcriptional regulator [Nitrospira sp.]
MNREQDILRGSVIGDEGVLSIEELARACRAEAQWIIELVAVGVLEPQGTEASRWRFRAADLTCARRVARLQRDFDASLDAAAVMLDLLDQIEQLRARLKRAGLDVE